MTTAFHSTFKTFPKFALLLCLAISACATLNEEECLTVDWRTLGDRDGSAGHQQTRLGAHLKACQKHGIAPNRAAYQSGWEDGIRRYCTPQNGMNVGQSGAAYAGSCPGDLAPGFTSAYSQGRALFTAKEAARRNSASINSLTTEIQTLIGKTDTDSVNRLREATNELAVRNAERTGLEKNIRLAQIDVDAFIARGYR